MANTTHIYVDQGSDYSFDLTAYFANGAVRDLSTYTVTAKFAMNYESSTKTSMTTAITSNTAGTITCSVSAETSNSVSSGVYAYDVLIDSTSNDVTLRIAEGNLTIRPNIS
jgi:hypothetical protein